MDKRNFTRVRFRSLAVVKSRLTQVKGATEDLSLNGVRVNTAQKLDLGKDVQIRILLRTRFSELWAEISGVVVRHEPNGMIIQFTSIPLDSYVHIRDVISRRLQDGRRVFDELFAHITGGSAKGPGAEVEFSNLFNMKVDQHMVPL